MPHVALGFMALLLHTKVTMKKIASPPDRGDHFCVELPRSYTVDQSSKTSTIDDTCAKTNLI